MGENAVRLPAGQHLRVLLFLCRASCYILFPDVGIAERSRQEESTMEKHSLLTLRERIEIEKALRDRASFSEIGTSLGKNPSTISKEVRHRSLDTILGTERFRSLFPVILTDRGSGFTDPMSIERDMTTGELRTCVFFCDPQCSNQKGTCEVTHEMIRRDLPKGTAFDFLSQTEVDLMMNHINSYARKKLNNRSAYQLFSFFYGDDILAQLTIRQIPANDINLTRNF